MLRVSEQRGVLNLTLERVCPIADSAALAAELLDACALATERADPLTAIVLHAAEDGFFLDAPTSTADCDSIGPSWRHAVATLARLPAPTLAVIKRQAVGPAWELALACDLRVAASEAVLGSPEIVWGRMPSAGGTQRLIRVAGRTVALRLLLSGQTVTGAEACELGLVHAAASDDRLADAVEAIMAALRASAQIALAYVKETTAATSQLHLSDGLRLEADLAALLHTTADRAEGIGAFLQRRGANFGGG